MSEGGQYGPKKSIKNWAEYNEGLKKRYDISVYLADAGVFEKPEPTGEGGRPKEYSDGYIELGLTLKAIYRMPYRGLEGFLRGLLRLNGLEDRAVPDFTTFCHRAKELKIAFRLAALEGQKINLLVDSTGLKIFGEGEWKMKMHGKTKRRTWRKRHLGVDEETQQIVVAVLRRNGVGDQEHLPDILDNVPEGINLSRVTADGIYDTWGGYDAANDHGAERLTPSSLRTRPGAPTIRAPRPSGKARSLAATNGRNQAATTDDLWPRPPCTATKPASEKRCFQESSKGKKPKQESRSKPLTFSATPPPQPTPNPSPPNKIQANSRKFRSGTQKLGVIQQGRSALKITYSCHNPWLVFSMSTHVFITK